MSQLVSQDTEPQTPNEPLPAGFVLQDYRIESVLSRGGFSIVYRALDVRDQPVALKEYLPAHLGLRVRGSTSPTVRDDQAAMFRYGLRCFFEEGRILAGLSHPNVVRVFNFFRANETAYLVMRYEHGRTLQQHVRARRGTLGERDLRRLFLQLLGGLREVHARRLLHLDLKPANIYVRNDGTPVLIDFGGARRTLGREGCDPDAPRERMLRPIYTPGFAPIELYRDRAHLGPWSDVYGIGATLYTCLAGKAPPPADRREAGDDYLPATERWQGRYSRHLLRTIDWCLEMAPEDRPQSVFELQKVLLGQREPLVHAHGGWLTRALARFTRAAGELGAAGSR